MNILVSEEKDEYLLRKNPKINWFTLDQAAVQDAGLSNFYTEPTHPLLYFGIPGFFIKTEPIFWKMLTITSPLSKRSISCLFGKHHEFPLECLPWRKSRKIRHFISDLS